MSMGHNYSGQAVVWELAGVGVALTELWCHLGQPVRFLGCGIFRWSLVWLQARRV